MSGPTLHTTTDDSVAILTLDRPPMNALDEAFCVAITEAFERVAADESIGAVVLTGSGPAFSAGVDLQIVPDLDVPAQDGSTAVADVPQGLLLRRRKDRSPHRQEVGLVCAEDIG